MKIIIKPISFQSSWWSSIISTSFAVNWCKIHSKHWITIRKVNSVFFCHYFKKNVPSSCEQNNCNFLWNKGRWRITCRFIFSNRHVGEILNFSANHTLTVGICELLAYVNYWQILTFSSSWKSHFVFLIAIINLFQLTKITYNLQSNKNNKIAHICNIYFLLSS